MLWGGGPGRVTLDTPAGDCRSASVAHGVGKHPPILAVSIQPQGPHGPAEGREGDECGGPRRGWTRLCGEVCAQVGSQEPGEAVPSLSDPPH